jgi:long-chain acyl-CoA synthetase
MAPEVIERTRKLLPHVKLVQVYGLSETGFLTGLQDHEHTQDRLLSCGRPSVGIDLQVTDESGKQVEVGKPGELVALAFRNGSFRTGDIGYQDSQGYFYILDRLKDMIVTGGENVYSGEVEAAICEHPAVREAAVFGIPDPKWGELVMACVVPKRGMALTADELVAHCRQSLASYKIPRRVEFQDTDLPKSGSGKILKRVLRDCFWVHQTRAVS